MNYVGLSAYYIKDTILVAENKQLKEREKNFEFMFLREIRKVMGLSYYY